jgi:DNA primase large subunit
MRGIIRERLPIPVPEEVCSSSHPIQGRSPPPCSSRRSRSSGRWTSLVPPLHLRPDHSGHGREPTSPCRAVRPHRIPQQHRPLHHPDRGVFQRAPDFDLFHDDVPGRAYLWAVRDGVHAPGCATMRTHGLCLHRDALCERVKHHPLTYYKRKKKLRG